MAMTFVTNLVGGNSDYMRYLSGPITKTDKINAPDLLDFTLINYDAAMVKPVRGTHIVLTTATYGVWFAGYIVNDPQLTYLGTLKNVPQWGYIYQATGEEYMLNQKPFGIVAPFINTTQGAVLKYLIGLLSPAGVSIDTSGITPGLSIPRFIVDPNKHFTEIVQDFAKAAHYQFRCQNFVATYKRQDSGTSGFAVDANSMHFTPSQLSMQPSGDPIINDSIVLGGLEPQNYMEELFMGDGATATFPLASSVFGLDSTVLLQDDMSSSTIDSSKWTVYDPTGAFLQPYGGTLNVLGGTNNGSLDVSLQSQSLIPLEGNVRLTHGEWDFVGGSGGNDGVLGGLWTGQTNGSMTGCLCAIRATPVGTGVNAGTILNPLVNGVVDGTQSATVNYSRRYVMRTLVYSKEAKRNLPSYCYRLATGSIQGLVINPPSDHFYATTVITEIDPITALTTNQWTWTNDLGVVLPVSAYYVPVASNNLNLTVQSITVSVPMQVTLAELPSGGTTWTHKMVGPNEVDCLDGMAPVATIVDSNNGASTRNSLLGSANYNPGQATLTYFKNTVQLISYLPDVGDLIHLSYRGAGAAIGRAQSKASIATEAAGWGDDGIRSETKRDLSPLPMTSQECQMAATARVNDNCYQHWTGTYTIASGSWVTAEPLAGSLITFSHLPAQFPSYLAAETITEVKTTIQSLRPKEQYTHVISFGPTTSIENVLASIKSTNDVFTPQDTAEIPQFIDVTAIGLTNIPSVPKVKYLSKTSSNWTFQFLDPIPSTVAGVEIRYTDSGWGADNGKNLITRIPYGTSTFTIPRTVRGKLAYMRCYDARNLLKYSEDFTNGVWAKSTGATVSSLRMTNRSGNQAMVNKVVFTKPGSGVGSTVTQFASGVLAAGNYGTFSMDIKGDPGTQVRLNVSMNLSPYTGTETVVTLTGKWQRISVTSPTYGATGAAIIGCSLRIWYPDNAVTVYATAASFELNKSSETVYCKTVSTTYGATSQFSTGLHTGLPMIPPAPTASGDFTDIKKPIISAILPANLTDVWGCEIRDADNLTVLFKTDLVNAVLTTPTAFGDTSMVLQTTGPALPTRNYMYWLYTYNLFGEYSAPYEFTDVLDALPNDVSGFTCTLSGTSEVLTWSAVTGASKYEIRYSEDSYPTWSESDVLWSNTGTTWTDTTARTGIYLIKARFASGLYSRNPGYTTPYPPPPVVTITTSTTNSSGSGSSNTAGDGVVVGGGVLKVTNKIWVTVAWTWSSSYRSPASFDVAVFTGSDPTNAANYLFPIANVDGAIRTYTVAVVPTSTINGVNAAVRTVYA